VEIGEAPPQQRPHGPRRGQGRRPGPHRQEYVLCLHPRRDDASGNKVLHDVGLWLTAPWLGTEVVFANCVPIVLAGSH